MQTTRLIEKRQILTQSEIERERYESRRKAQLDYNSGLKEAERKDWTEGRVEGGAEGEKMGIIHICESLLNRPITPVDQLERMSPAELTRLADDLQVQVRQK